MSSSTGIRPDRPSGTTERALSPRDVDEHVHAMTISGARFADLFGSIEDGRLVIRLVWALDGAQEYQVVEWPAHGASYPPLSDVTPAAFVEECEIYEQFAVSPHGGRALDRLVVPPRADFDFPRLGRAPSRDRPLPHAPHHVTGEAFELPFGPVRGVAQESLYVGLVTSGEELLDLYLLQWHKHRGVERRLRGCTADRALFMVERTEGLSAVANGWAFCRALEAIAGITPAPEADLSRGIALELERLYNHAASIAALCQATGLSVGQAQAEILLEECLRTNAAVFGHRYLFGVLAPGGVWRAPDTDALGDGLRLVAPSFRHLVELLWSTNSFVDRLESCGIVVPADAARLGLVGPVARASAVGTDVRRDHPFGPYEDVEPNVAVGVAGDVMARLAVMSAEADESARIALDLAGRGPGASVTPVPLAPGAALGWTESSRGESLAWVSLDADGRIRRARLRPASVRNWRAFDDAVRSRNVFTDVPIIEASFWLTVAGFAR